MFRPPLNLERSWRTKAVLAFVLAWLALRALIPAGFMPQADAWREGRFVMTICEGTGGMKTIVVDDDGQPVDEQSHHSPDDAALHMEPCPFAMLGALLALPVVMALLVLLLFARAIRITWPHPRVGLLAAFTGPPLGSRAPPFVVA